MSHVDETIIAASARERFGLDGDVTAHFVRHGENTTYRVSGDAGDWAFRLHRPDYRTPAMVRSELDWMSAIRASGIATPSARSGVDGDVVQVIELDGQERLATLLSWEQGDPLEDSSDMRQWRELGRLMAEVHLHGAAWQRPDRFERPAWDLKGMIGSRPHWGDPIALGTWTDRQLDLLSAARECVRRRLAAFGQASERYGLVHADLSFANVLARGGASPVLIDFDDCGWGWYLWELAVTLAPFDGEPGFDQRRDAIVEGYRLCRDLPDSELAELPTFLMARRFVTLGWVFTHAETEHARRQRDWRIRTFPAAARRFLADSSTEGL